MRSLAARLEQQQRSHPSAIDLTLDRVREVARRLDLLRPACRVITVAGTNGKGSTVAFLDAFLRAAQRRCGRFTSPHLRRYNERICVDGEEASDAELLAAFDRIDAARGDLTLTFFEYNALAALEHFRSRAVEIAVLEVGLGGRLDATNIVDADVGVVCSIGLDHVDWLGASLDGIGREKAGIFRRGRPAVLGSADLPRSVEQAIESIGALRVAPGHEYRVHRHAGHWDFECRGVEYRELPPPAMPGVHQVGNAATALAAIAVADFGMRLSKAQVLAGLAGAQLAGRFQVIPGEIEWVLDVAHNEPAAAGLAHNLAGLPRRRTLAVCGILGDKDIAAILAVLADAIDAWFLARLEGPRAVDTRELATRLPPGASVLAQAPDVAAACRAARAAARPGDRIVVFGSFLTVGPALEFLGI